jgi:surface carbohydrate biosynthesis protein
MKQTKNPPPADQRLKVVVLVDSKTRDLPLATLLAYHLDNLGVECLLEPLEAYRAVAAAHQPSLILFNHLTASHLVKYSQRLAAMGVLTAVLPNEGIYYDEDDLKFNSGQHHSGAHVDYFFCWNELHRQALSQSGFSQTTRIEVIGVPRFDFYFEPWSRLYHQPAKRAGGRPNVLLCTNFVTAKYWELPREQGDKFFAAWKDRIPLYSDYWPAIEAHHKGRQRITEFIRQIAADGRYDLTFRPHPRETIGFYEQLIASLPQEHRQRITVDAGSSITKLILNCDAEISCETCTTALESWIAGKPTIELLLEKHPLWHYQEAAKCGLTCDDPGKITDTLAAVLSTPPPENLQLLRQAHLRKWCQSPAGTSCQQLAKIISQAVYAAKKPDWSKLTAADRRRGLKLKMLQKMGKAYHFDPLMPLKMSLRPDYYAIKNQSYSKAIEPADVAAARNQLIAVLGQSGSKKSPA